jgi:hypothetical protein
MRTGGKMTTETDYVMPIRYRPVSWLLRNYLPDFCWQSLDEIYESLLRLKPTLTRNAVSVSLHAAAAMGVVEIAEGDNKALRNRVYRRAA